MSEQILFNEPVKDVLKEGLLHKILVAFYLPTSWPGWAVMAGGALLAAQTTAIWWLVLRERSMALAIGAILFLFIALDAIILYLLPKRRLSFGPWKAQFFLLALPRTFVATILSFAAILLGWQWGAALVILAQLVGTTTLIWGAITEPFRLELTQLMVTTDGLPASAPPVRILHITDVHLERLTRREEAILRLVKETRPDLIVITGDYVNTSYNRDAQTLAQVRQFLSQLSAPYGVYATLGSPPVDLRETVVPLFEGLPIHLMRGEWRQVNLSCGRQIGLLGMDCTHHIPSDEVQLKQITRTASDDILKIFLYHSPELMPQAAELGIDLYLCGHTHGGQVRLPIVGPLLTSSQLGRKYVMGLYKERKTYLYVSRGVGLEGLSAPRVRFMAPPEITLITLNGG